jgi:addiction module HigA family antidote
MSISIEDIDNTDFSSVTTVPANRLPPIHPGEILQEEFLKPLGITQYQLAKAIGVSQRRIGEITTGKRAITADTSLRLARFFGLHDKFWLGLQIDYDTAKAKNSLTDVLAQITRFDTVIHA